jgi:hypothetical protein
LLLIQDLIVAGSGQLRARGTADIMVADGTREQEPPESAASPAVIGWRVEGRLEPGDLLYLEAARAGAEVGLVIRPVIDTVTHVDVIALREEVRSDGR